MPYVTKNARYALDIEGDKPQTVGELNYLITRAIQIWIRDHGGESYTNYNSVIGFLLLIDMNMREPDYHCQAPENMTGLYKEVGGMIATYLRRSASLSLMEVRGVVECVKLEFYRRAVAAYEDEKCKENGDVYDIVGRNR